MPYPYKSICVFCASADNLDQSYYAAAREMGRLLAQQKIALVYGGGRTGLMGALAEGALARGRRGDRRCAARAWKARSSSTPPG